MLMTLGRARSGVNLLFTHDTEAALASVAALVNTLPGSVPGDTDPDTLTTVAELDRLLAAHGWGGRGGGPPARLEGAARGPPGRAGAGPVAAAAAGRPVVARRGAGGGRGERDAGRERGAA